MATKNDTRQYPLTALTVVTPENMGDGNEITVAIPGGALVTVDAALCTTAFNSGTTATLTVADGTTTFVNAQSIATTGAKTIAVSQKYYPTPATITVSAAQTGDDATVGEALVSISYVIKNRWSETQD